MIEVFISINNNEEVMQLPVPIEPYKVSSPWSNETFEGLQQDLNLIGTKGLKSFDISSFFPVNDYPFLQNRNMWGMEYVDTIECWRDKRYPMRIIITSNDPNIQNLNMAVTIDNFEYETRKDGDIYYTLFLKEFPFVKVNL